MENIHVSQQYYCNISIFNNKLLVIQYIFQGFGKLYALFFIYKFELPIQEFTVVEITLLIDTVRHNSPAITSS